MLQYLNDNQGAIMALLTLAYVGATLLLVWLAQKQAKLTQHSLAQFREAEERRRRPYVVFDILCEVPIAYAVVKNSGASPALNVLIEVEPKLRWDARAEKGPEFVETGIAFLAPGREVSEPFSAGEDFYKGYEKAKFAFSGCVSYTDAEGARYREPFRIDVAYTQTMMSIGKPDAPYELKKIREALEKIGSREFSPLVRTIDQKDYAAHMEAERARRSAVALKTLEARARLSSQTKPDAPLGESANP